MTALRWVYYVCVAEILATTPQKLNLLWKTMEALDRALDYLDEQLENINLDGVLGVRMADDQISLLLKRTALFRKRRLRILFRSMSLLQRKAERLADIAMPIMKYSDPEYYKNIGKILSDGLWLLNYTEREIRSKIQSKEVSSEEKIDETKSDKCFSEVVGIEYDTYCPCRISEECWTLMTAPKYSGYSLTHQVIFLQLTDMCMCQRKVEPFFIKYNQSNLDFMYDNFCSYVLNEAETIINGNKKTKQDLFMEQIAICGMVGFVDFYRPEWLKAILSWQEPNGCYTERFNPTWPEVSPESKRRTKREEKILDDGCHSHTTSVAVITLAVNIRFILTQEP